MAGINKVILIGNLGSDPEVRHLPSNSKVATFNIATTENYTNRNGERTSQTEWHRLELWDRLAEIAEQYLQKGSTIYVEGKLKTDSYTDKDGNQRSVTKVRVLSMQMLDKRSSMDGGNNTSGWQNHQQQPASPQKEEAESGDYSSTDQNPGDDLPF